MIDKFIEFRDAVNKKYEELSKNGTLYLSAAPKDEVGDKYLSSFPEGTNKPFRERTEHDCSCCKNYVRQVGRVLGHDNEGNLSSVWDVKVDSFYQQVADSLSDLNKKAGIGSLFLHDERSVGVHHNHEKVGEDKEIMWNHFYSLVPDSCYRKTGFIAKEKGEAFTNRKVLKRSLEEISSDAVEIVLELIDGNSIYRGEEHQQTVQLVGDLQEAYSTATNKDLFLWDKAVLLGGACALRNTVIGKLLVDISEGVDLESAVASFESHVAPQNYKRPKSTIITPSMKKAAKERVESLGINNSFFRRHATKEDISVNDVLFADETVKEHMQDSVLDLVKTDTPANLSPENLSRIKTVSVDKFLKDILPEVEGVELYLENKFTPNLMTLVAPQYANAPTIMRWGNNFSHSYNGGLADSSISENVKKAGGDVGGDVRFSIQWNDDVENLNDLDAHCIQPNNLEEIHFPNKGRRFSSTGMLDVDVINPSGVAVENINFTDKNSMPVGEYVFFVHNYSGRGGRDFKAEIEVLGEVHQYHYKGGFKNSQRIKVATVTKYRDTCFTIKHHMEENSKAKQNVWGVDTQNFHKVTMIMNSPNYWDNASHTGNKHLFFILDNCKNPDKVRGFYNEYLPEIFKPDRKVFEVLANELQADYSDDQLSGVGFSSTKQNEVVLKVRGKSTRLIKVLF